MQNKTPIKAAYAKFRAVLLSTILFSFFINLLMFIGPLYMLQVYDRVLASRNETTLFMLSLIAISLLVIFGLLEFVRSRVLVRAGLQFDDVLASPLFGRVVQAQLTNPNSQSQYALSDIDKIREFLTGQGLIAFFDAPWVPLFLALCYIFHPWLGFVAIVGAVIIFALALANELMTRESLKQAGNASQDASHFAGVALQNSEVIRALGMERELESRWTKRHDGMLVDQARASDRAGGILATSKFVRMALQTAILGTGAYLALLQEISPGVMIAASIIMGRALAPVELAVSQWKQFIAARQAHGRLTNLFKNIEEENERTDLPEPIGELTIAQLTSFIPGTKFNVLKNINFNLEPGEILTIIGPSGSGKSSLVRHLVGVWPAVSGTVRLDGAELSHWDPEKLGEHLGYLPQDVKLFPGSVAENISRFKSMADSEKIIEAAQIAGAHDMIQHFGDGYETEVGDRGMQLSGGQRQRVGLARALYGNPKLVVLDEPNSNLDSAGEEALTDALRRLKSLGTTVVVVTHKPNLLAVSDKVLILDNGMVQNFLPTADLLKANPTIASVKQPPPPQQPAAPFTVNLQQRA